MSMQAVLDFWKRAAGDEGLQQKLRTLPVANRADAIVRLGAQQGCSFTRKEFDEMGAAGAFLYRAQTDAGLRQKVSVARKLKDRAAQRTEVMRIAGDAGYRFQPEQLSRVMALATLPADAELSDRQLDQVSGGFLLALLAACVEWTPIGASLKEANEGMQQGLDQHKKNQGQVMANPQTGEGDYTRPGPSGGGLPGFP